MCLESIACMGLNCCKEGIKNTSENIEDKIAPYRLHITRLTYGLFLVFGFILALFFRDGFFHLLEWVPAFRQSCKIAEDTFSTSCVGKNSVYRISFSLVLFYLTSAFLSSRLFCVGDRIRLYLAHKWFILKVPFFVILLVFPFFIPNVVFIVWAWITLIMSGIFIIIQIILLIDFGYSWQKRWSNDNIDEEGFKIWDWLLIIFSILLFIIAIAFHVINFIIFGSGAQCHLNRFLICFTIILGILSTVASLVLRRGIVPPAVITAFCSFMCWCSLMSDPSTTCNILKNNPNTNYVIEIITIVLGIVFATLSLLRAAIATGSSFSRLFQKQDDGNEEDLDSEENLRLECQEIFYSHIIFIFASCYMCMVLVSWTVDTTNHQSWKIEESIAAMWVKIVSSWLTYLLFGWTLIAPKILGKCRDFEDQ